MRGAGALAVLLASCSFVESVDDYAGEPKDAGTQQDAAVDAGDGSPWPGCGLGQKSCDDKCVGQSCTTPNTCG